MGQSIMPQKIKYVRYIEQMLYLSKHETLFGRRGHEIWYVSKQILNIDEQIQILSFHIFIKIR